MTSLASIGDVLLTGGKFVVIAMIYSCLAFGVVAYGVAKRRDREAAESDAELDRLCQEGQRFRINREQRRCLGGRRVA